MAVIAVFLTLAVACARIGSFGFARFGSAYDWLHCVTFVAVTAVIFVVVAAFVADGVSGRTLKILVFFLLTLANGAAVAHATGRAVMRRAEDGAE
jgi:multicomponent Na+:H+ antiporter subunit G